MKDLLEFIVTNLVTKPEAVTVEEQSQDGNVDLLLTVDPEDMGLIIGKSGQTIRAIRKLLTVRAIAENVRVNLQLNDPQGNQPKEAASQAEEAPKDEPAKEAKTEEVTEADQPAEEPAS